MQVVKVHIQRNTNKDGSITYGLRWVLGINPRTRKPKWHRKRVCQSEPHPTAKRIRKWEAEVADARYEKEKELNAEAIDFVIACERAEAARAYLLAKDGHLAPSTIDRQQITLTRFNCYLNLNSGPKNVSGVGIRHVAQYRDYLSEVGLAPATVNCQLQDLSAFFRWCVGESYAAKNPARACNRIEHDPSRATLPIKSAAQFWAMLDRLPDPRQRATIGLLACTGMRIGEARALTWDCWDEFNDTLIVGIGYDRPERTKRHRRVIPLCQITTGFLRALRAINGDGSYVIGSRGGEKRLTSQAGTWLAGFGLSAKHLRCWFRTALETVDARNYIIDDLLGHRTGKVRKSYTPAENLDASRPVIERFDVWLRAGMRDCASDMAG